MHTLYAMDTSFFRERQRELRLTNDDLAQAIGRDRSVISRIWSGERQMKPSEVRAIAEKLALDIDIVIEKAGLNGGDILIQAKSVYQRPHSVEDASLWQPEEGSAVSETRDMAQLLGGARPGVDIWQVRNNALILEGYREGDFLLVDHNAAPRARAGEVVVAQVYDHQGGGATTLLRRYEPPVLVGCGFDPDERTVHVVDGKNVAIRGVVIASWRGGVRH